MQLARRSFLALGSLAVPALWVKGLGALTLPSQTLRVLGGTCSFCGKATVDQVTLYGVGGRPPRICNECMSLCLDIFAEEGTPMDGADEWADLNRSISGGTPNDAWLEAQRYAARSSDELERFVREQLSRPDAAPTGYLRLEPLVPPCCSFCDRRQADAWRLIAGPAAYICDACVTGVLSFARS